MEFVFISYSSKDKEMALAICHALEENGIPCWIAPRDITPGMTWPAAVMKAIRECKLMVLVYSANANDSSQVANEIDRAFSNNKTIIPFMADTTPMNDEFDYYLSRRHWLIAYPDYRKTLDPLVETVKSFLEKTKEETNTPEPAEPETSNPEPAEPETSNPEPAEPETSNPKPAEPETSTHDALTPIWADWVSDEQKEIISKIIDNMVRVEGSVFFMGATPEQKGADKDEKPAHRVTMSTYHIGKYTVTQEEWEAVMGSNPSKKKGKRMPVNKISLLDCLQFVRTLQQMCGINFAIPTEAEWEYAARGGNLTKGYIYSGSNDVKEVAQNSEMSDVGLKKPNELGIYDMSGNVCEWCCEEKGKYTLEPVTDPYNLYKPGFWDTDFYVLRGGYYFSGASSCRVSHRSGRMCDGTETYFGLRLVVIDNPREYKFEKDDKKA